jgi:hypothetical protein
VFGAVVTEVVKRAAFVPPGTHIDTIIVEEAGCFDIAFVGPSSGAVEERVNSKRTTQAENE